MLYLVRVSAYYNHRGDYVVNAASDEAAKNRAYDFFKNDISCYVPETVEDAEETDYVEFKILSDDVEIRY